MDLSILLRAFVGALIGGSIGAAAWCAVSVTTGYELGILAWGVGLLAGVGARIAATSAETSDGTGALAAVVALLAIIAGKWFAASILVSNVVSDPLSVSAVPLEVEDCIVDIADDIIIAREEAGMTVQWPTAARIDTATEQHEYPADVWREATERWRAMSEPEREALRERLRTHIADFIRASSPQLRTEAFKSSFGLFDIIFIGLAMYTAYRIGAGGGESEEKA